MEFNSPYWKTLHMKYMKGYEIMKEYRFTGRGVCSEFNISEIGRHYGITKKVKWEEPLIINTDMDNDKYVYVYHFGVIVFINYELSEMDKEINLIKNIKGSIKNFNKDINYDESEKYILLEDENVVEKEIEFDIYRDKVVKRHLIGMTALVLAKSVALEIIEINIDKVFDEIEYKVHELRSGILRTNEKRTISSIGKILAFKHTTISYIMMLDKPSITWKDQEVEEYFNEMADLFELDDRYDKLNAKIETLLNTAGVIVDLQHSKKANIMEFIVVILILIEVIDTFKEPILSLIRNLIH